ncbi:MAG: endonuclease, partial [Pseudomonadota bacterium]
HIWPKAFGWNGHRTAQADLHNIIPTDPARNAKRGAGRFYSDVFDRFQADQERGELLSPNPEMDTRGVVARACLYMVIRYQGQADDPKLELDEQVPVIGEPHLSSLTTLLHWNKMNPPTGAERRRNVEISALQGNRNPFVDNPDFADLLWRPV